MSTTNPAVYYSDESLQGNYQYVALEELVNTFISNYVDDGNILSNTKRRNVLYWMKKGIQEFTIDVLREIKVLELDLGDNLEIVLPPDYLNYVRISWLDKETGKFRPMSVNNNIAIATTYLQDHEYEILFDNLGFPLEGTSNTEIVNDSLRDPNRETSSCTCTGTCSCGYGGYHRAIWNLDTTINYNGTFNIDKARGKIHFSSDNLTRTIILEYISDGLEYSNESDIRINKMAQTALMNWTFWNIIDKKDNIQEYKVQRARKDYFTSLRTAKIRMMNIKPQEFVHVLNGRKKWLR